MADLEIVNHLVTENSRVERGDGGVGRKSAARIAGTASEGGHLHFWVGGTCDDGVGRLLDLSGHRLHQGAHPQPQLVAGYGDVLRGLGAR